jgi:hypothetical protein
MERPKLTEQDLARIDTVAVKADIGRLLKVVDSMAYSAPDSGEAWQIHLHRAAELMTAIADGLRLTPPRDQPLAPGVAGPRRRK